MKPQHTGALILLTNKTGTSQEQTTGFSHAFQCTCNSVAGDACEYFSNILTHAKYSHGFVMLFEAEFEKWDCYSFSIVISIYFLIIKKECKCIQ